MTTLGEYVTQLYDSGEDTLLQRMRQEAAEQGLPAINIPDEVGRLLQILIGAARVRTILEIGTLFGYSAVWMARALPAEGRIVSLEAEPKHVEIARRNLERAGLADRVEVRPGNALDTLATLDGWSFDMVFIDADKVSYPQYLERSLGLTRSGSLIIADNVWRRGNVTRADADDSATVMARFNEQVAHEPRLLSTIIPTRDGNDALTVALVR